MTFTIITNVRVFDGHLVFQDTTVVLQDDKIESVGGSAPDNATVIDGSGMTLLPGLLDAHVHTRPEHLAIAIKFGVTTELEMMGHWTWEQRKEISSRTDVADIRSAGFGLTAPGGHPGELHARMKQGPPHSVAAGRRGSSPHISLGHKHPPQNFVAPTAATVPEAEQFVRDRLAAGADYIKIMIEEGSVLDEPGLPILSNEAYAKAVSIAHENNKIAIAHALTLEATKTALDVGVDGLAHLFIDQPHTPAIVEAIAKQKTFVTPCLVLNASIMGISIGAELAKDERVSSKLDQSWTMTLQGLFNTFPKGNFNNCLKTVLALHQAGVDILAGTDVSVPTPALGGLAHGASVHQEMQLLVQAGLSPVEALKSATSVPARRFGLTDRGRVAKGFQADLLLVEGDPTTNINDSLNVRGVWRKGIKLRT